MGENTTGKVTEDERVSGKESAEQPAKEDIFEEEFARAVAAIEKRSGSKIGPESLFLFHRELWNSMHK